MPLRDGEEGKIFRVHGLIDMSQNTELTLSFRQPDGQTITKTKTGGDVTLGTVDVNDPDLGLLLANYYVEYFIEPGFLIAGDWCVYITYTNTTAVPDQTYVGASAEFTVDAIGCS